MNQQVYLQRSYDNTRSFLETCDDYATHEGPPDIEFICMDGKILAHQFMLTSHSELLRSIFNRFQTCEFHIGDWNTGQLLLLDRHKGFEMLSISVPDVSARHVNMMLSCFYRGTINLDNNDDARTLKAVWDLFEVDSVKLEHLAYEKVSNPTPFPVKSEPEDELDIKPNLETTILECNVCKEPFVLEEHLSKHMETSHQLGETMNDRVDSVDVTTKDDTKSETEVEKEAPENEKHLQSEVEAVEKTVKKSKKGKGKGKGKKSVQPERLLRKLEKVADENPIPEKESSDNIQPDDSPSEKSSEEKGMKVSEKRPACDADSSTIEPSPKRIKQKSESSSQKSESSSSDKTATPEDDDRTWDDITCIVCQQQIAVWMARPGGNRRRYQQHLLKHFLDSQYNEIQEGLRIYQCSYEGCSYAGGDKNPYVHHIAFKHDEWFKRINKQIEKASGDANNLEDLNAIKEFFISDYRVLNIKTKNTKPLWVEGTAMGKEAEKEELKPNPPTNTDTNQNKMEVDDEIEMETMETTETPEKNKKCIHCDEQFPNEMDLHEHIKIYHKPPAPKIPKDIWKVAKVRENSKSPKTSSPNSPKHSEIDSPKEPDINIDDAKPKEGKDEEKIAESTSSDKPNTANLKPDKSKKHGDGGDKLQCVYCNKVMTLVENPSKNKQAYQIHLMEHHFNESLFSDIPEKEKYFCPYRTCNFPGTELKLRFILHLAFSHREFSRRINRRVKQLEKDAKSFDDHNECTFLRDLQNLFQSDPRVIDITNPIPGDTWAQDCDVVTADSIAKATAPGSKPALPVARSLMSQLQVEISEDWLIELKAEPIKQEPGQPPVDDSLPLITLSTTPVIETSVTNNPIDPRDEFSGEKNKDKNKQTEKKVEEDEQEIDESEKVKLPEAVEATAVIITPKQKSEETTESPFKIPKLLTETLTTPIEILTTPNETTTTPNEISTTPTETSTTPTETSTTPVETSTSPTETEAIPNEISTTPNETPIAPIETSAKSSEGLKDLPLISENTVSSTDVWSCKKCQSEFGSRPAAATHIIETHVEHYGQIPFLIGEKYYCRYEVCKYETYKRYALLSHYVVKHKEISLPDIHKYINFPLSDDFRHQAFKLASQTPSTSAQPQTPTSSENSSPEEEKKIKEEFIIKETPVEIISGKDEIRIVWNCTECKRSFETEDAIRQHIITKHLVNHFDSIAPPGLPIYGCKQCIKTRTYSSTNRINFIKHLGMTHQVVSSEEVESYIRREEKLLLDIDVIKCRCKKSFVTEKQLREHIIFSHFKNHFKSIPRQHQFYQCSEPKCPFSSRSRTALIKHKVAVHKTLTEKQIYKYIPSNNDESSSSSSSSDSSSEEEIESNLMDLNDGMDSASNAPTEPSTYYNDDVSIIEDEGSMQSRMAGQLSFANNRCPVCEKVIALWSNFEDHLQTHGIKQQVVLSCIGCGFATSFAQLFYHINSYHSESTSITISCLACQEVMLCDKSVSAVIKLKEHCLSTNTSKNVRRTPNEHKCKANLYNTLIINGMPTLYSTYRYSCQHCNFYFKTWEDLKKHGTRFNSSCQRKANGVGVRMDPVYECHLCDYNKASSVFENHFCRQDHQQKVILEFKKDKAKYGVGPKDYYYACEPCGIASTFNNIVAHLKLGNPACKRIQCIPCALEVESPTECPTVGPLELANFLEHTHILLDQHTEGVFNFKIMANSNKMWRFKYFCVTCSTCFINEANLHNHTNCKKLVFRCMSCDYTCPSVDIILHLNTSLHKQMEAHRKVYRRTPPATNSQTSNSSTAIIHNVEDDDNILHIEDEDNVPQSDIVEILDDSPENSPPQQARPSVTMFRTNSTKPSLPSQRLNYQSQARSSQLSASFPRPPSPAESVTEIEVRHNPPTFSIPSNLQVQPLSSAFPLPSASVRAPSPAESVMEVEDSRPASPTPSVTELDNLIQLSMPVMPVTQSRKNRQSAFEPPSQLYSANQMRDSPPLHQNYTFTLQHRAEKLARAGPSTQWTVGSPPPRGRVHSPSTSTSTVQRSNGSPSVSNMRNQFECREPCKMIFNTPGAFKEHAAWHDKTNSYAILECHICGWRVADQKFSQSVSMHLVNIKHTVNVTKKLSSFN